MKTFEEWVEHYVSTKCYKDNNYAEHYYGTMLVNENKRKVICFFPLVRKNDTLYDVIVNTHKIPKNMVIDNNLFNKLNCNVNYDETCIRHRMFHISKAYKLYKKHYQEFNK